MLMRSILICTTLLLFVATDAFADAAATQTAAAQATATAGTAATQTAVANAQATQTAAAVATVTAAYVLPTATAAAPTPTLAPQNTPSNLGASKGCSATKFCAWKYGRVQGNFGTCSSAISSATVVIPGLQKRDFIMFAAPNDASGTVPLGTLITGNNTVVITAACTTSTAHSTLEYWWWDRTDPRGSQFDVEDVP